MAKNFMFMGKKGSSAASSEQFPPLVVQAKPNSELHVRVYSPPPSKYAVAPLQAQASASPRKYARHDPPPTTYGAVPVQRKSGAAVVPTSSGRVGTRLGSAMTTTIQRRSQGRVIQKMDYVVKSWYCENGHEVKCCGKPSFLCKQCKSEIWSETKLVTGLDLSSDQVELGKLIQEFLKYTNMIKLFNQSPSQQAIPGELLASLKKTACNLADRAGFQPNTVNYELCSPNYIKNDNTGNAKIIVSYAVAFFKAVLAIMTKKLARNNFIKSGIAGKILSEIGYCVTQIAVGVKKSILEGQLSEMKE